MFLLKSRSLSLVLLAAAAPSIAPAITANISAYPLAPQPVGTSVTWTVSTDAAEGTALWYRFRVRDFGGEFRTVRDFGPGSDFTWAPTDKAGYYDVEATVRNLADESTATAVYPYLFRTRVFTGEPAVTPTEHPLVMMYSAPACPLGSRLRIEFQSAEGEPAQVTSDVACNDGLSMNIPVGGLRADTEYTFQQILTTGDSEARGPQIKATSRGGLPEELLKPQQIAGAGRALTPGFILQAPLFLRKALATDYQGRVVWYYPGQISYLTRASGGFVYGIITTTGGPADQVVKEIDLIGITQRETNAARVSEQLRDQFKRPISSFHHEALPLPDGKLLVIGTVERKLTGVQGPG